MKYRSMMIMKSVCPNTVFAVKIHKAVLLSYQAPWAVHPGFSQFERYANPIQ
jgi:hypothetical protein